MKSDKIVVIKKEIPQMVYEFLTIEFRKLHYIESYCCYYTQNIRFISKKRIRIMLFTNETVDLSMDVKTKIKTLLNDSFEYSMIDINESGVIDLVEKMSETGIIFHEL